MALAYLSPMFGSSSACNGNPRGAMCIAGHCCCTGRAEAETLRQTEHGAQAAPDARPEPVRRSCSGSIQIRGAESGAAGATALLLRMRQGGRSSESARLLSGHACVRVRNLHGRGAAGEADGRPGFAGRSDSRRDPQEFRARQLKSNWRRGLFAASGYFNHNRFDAFECRSAAAVTAERLKESSRAMPAS